MSVTADRNGVVKLSMRSDHDRETEKMWVETLDEAEEDKDAGKDSSEDGDSNPDERPKWSSKREYILTVMGYTVGIGNIWRFPYVCIRNGGGAFLLPFLLALLFLGMPLFFLEAAVGQFASKSPFQVWAVCPLVKGLGVAVCILSSLAFWYYNVIMAWTFYYLVSSFQSVVPWSLCGQSWNTARCVGPGANLSNTTTMSNFNVTSANISYANDASLNLTSESSLIVNITDVLANGTDNKLPPVTAAEEFWLHNVLQVSSGLYDTGHLVWHLALAQTVVVTLIFLFLIKGIKSSGKVVYVTATLPYLLLSVLLVRGATLPGAKEGILYYLTPDFNSLLIPQVWVEAALQVFYSLGPAWGGIITMSSFNKFNNNCLRDSVLLSLLGEGTSIFGGFAIFSVLGYMAKTSGVAIKDVVSSGPGLAFVVYPEAVSLLPLPQLWAVLFFLMVVSLLVDTQLTVGETVLTILCDQFPKVVGRRRILVTAIFCGLALVTSFGLVTQGGIYVFQLIDWFIATYTVTVISFLECVALAWIYGIDRFGDDIKLMLGRRPPYIFTILWCFVIPVTLVVLLVSTLARYSAPKIGEYTYDGLANVLGWMVATVSFLPIPLIALKQISTAKGSLAQRWRQVTTADESWGPSDPARRRLYRKETAQRPTRRHWYDVFW